MNKEILSKRLQVEVPTRCTQHQCVKGAACDMSHQKTRNCLCCAYYTLSLKAATCVECLATEHLDNFIVDEQVAQNEMYQYMVEHEGE